MMSKMGFGDDKIQIRNTYGMKVRATVGGQAYTFKSKMEYAFALYLNFLFDCNEIADWKYEPKKFLFPNQTTAPTQYTLDFWMIDNKGHEIYYECKCWGKQTFTGKDKTKQSRMKKYYPNVKIQYVFDRIPVKQAIVLSNRLDRINILCDRVIDFSVIKKQLKGYVNFDAPFQVSRWNFSSTSK
jgi:hypothetical protein